MNKFDWRGLLRNEGGSVLMIVFGVLLAMKPDLASTAVSALIGWVLILMGVALLLVGFLGRTGMGTVASGAVLLLVGNWFHRNPLMIASVLGFLLGIVVLKQGAQAARDVGRIKSGGGFWIPGAVLAAVEILVGIRLILSPLSISRLVLSIIGVLMAACGACNLVAYNKGIRYIRAHDDIIDAE